MLKCGNHRAFVAAAAVFFDAEITYIFVMSVVFFVVMFTFQIVVVMVVMSVFVMMLCVVTLLISDTHSVEKIHSKACCNTYGCF